MKRFILWLTRPKITIFLKSGNVIRTRKEMCELMDIEFKYIDFIDYESCEFISIRKWWQLWQSWE